MWGECELMPGSITAVDSTEEFLCIRMVSRACLKFCKSSATCCTCQLPKVSRLEKGSWTAWSDPEPESCFRCRQPPDCLGSVWNMVWTCCILLQCFIRGSLGSWILLRRGKRHSANLRAWDAKRCQEWLERSTCGCRLCTRCERPISTSDGSDGKKRICRHRDTETARQRGCAKPWKPRVSWTCPSLWHLQQAPYMAAVHFVCHFQCIGGYDGYVRVRQFKSCVPRQTTFGRLGASRSTLWCEESAWHLALLCREFEQEDKSRMRQC